MSNGSAFKRVIIIVALIIVAIVIFVMYLGSPGPHVLRAMSDDGNLLLQIPSTAMPDGVSLSDISVTRDTEEEDLTYILEPDGLVFEDDVQMTITTDVGEGYLPDVKQFNQVGDQERVTTFGDIEIFFDGDANKFEVSTPIRHFSRVILIDDGGYFRIDMTVPDVVLIGDGVGGRVNVIHQADDRKWNLDFDLGFRIVPETIRMSGELTVASFGNVTPKHKYENRPPMTEFISSFEVIVDPSRGDYVCTLRGPNALIYNAKFNYDEVSIVGEPDPEHWIFERKRLPRSISLSGRNGFRCVEPPPPPEEETEGFIDSPEITERIGEDPEKRLCSAFSAGGCQGVPPGSPYDPVQSTPCQPGQTCEPIDELGRDGRVMCFCEDPPGVITLKPAIDMSFSHVEPGVYSEVYLSVGIASGFDVEATLTGPGVADPPTQTIVSDENGQSYFVWKIVAFGTYEATIKIGEREYDQTIVVN